MELLYCLSVAVLIVTARTFGQWSELGRLPLPPDTIWAKTMLAIVQFLSFACAGFALGLLDGFLTLELSGNRNAGIPLLIAAVMGMGVVCWGAIRGVRVWWSTESP